MQRIYKSLAIYILAVVLAACRPGIGPVGSPGAGTTTTQPDPAGIVKTPEPGTVTPTYAKTDQPSPPGSPTATDGQISPSFNPTRLPEPHLVHILDWEMVTANSNVLCAGCEGDIVMVAAPRDLRIAVVRIYSEGVPGDAAAVDSDLAFSLGVDCQVDSSEEYCGLIFGQVRGGVLTLRAKHEAGEAHQLTYFITFQSWADYTPP